MCSGKVRRFSGANDRKSAFQSSVPSNVPLLHISTHAVADYERPELSRLLFSPPNSESASDFLFLKELYSTDLRGLDMAVLSACDTERATIIRGEGLQGFSRALLAAGSRTAVTTLWRVDDEATAEFMKQFYFFLLQKGMPKSQALRMAKLKFLRSNSRLSEPRYWAAFVLNGDGSARPRPVHLMACVHPHRAWLAVCFSSRLTLLFLRKRLIAIRSLPEPRHRRCCPLVAQASVSESCS